MANCSSTVVENLTQGHKFEGLNTAAAFIGGRKSKQKGQSKLANCNSTVVENLTRGHKFKGLNPDIAFSMEEKNKK
jgi:hypothetical protein